METNLFTTTGQPVYQPLTEVGWRYRYDARGRSYWQRLGSLGSHRHYRTADVAADTGITRADLLRWENETDLEDEQDQRANMD